MRSMRQRRHKFWVYLIGLALILVFGSGLPFVRAQLADFHNGKTVTKVPRGLPTMAEDRLCGPRSVAGAAARLGLWVDPNTFAARCPASESGISLLSLRDATAGFKLKATGARLTWNELRRLPGPAVLFLRPNHFAFTDSRESAGSGQEALRFYDYPNPARWITQKELSQRWGGEVLIIEKGRGCESALVFDSLLSDFGAAYAADVPTYDFRMRNMGNTPVKIMEVKKTCGCTKAELSRAELKPGEEASVSVSVDLKGRQGMQRQVVYLRTTDSAQPVVPLTLQGSALVACHVSTDAIDLGQVIPGQHLAYEFVVTDRNDGALQLTSLRYREKERSPDGEDLAVQGRWQTTDRSFDEMLTQRQTVVKMTTIIRGKGSRRYLVSLDIDVSPTARTGLKQGLLALATNNAHSPKIDLPVIYQVVSDVQLVPEVVSLGIARGGGKAQKTFILKNLSDQMLRDSASPLKVTRWVGDFEPRVSLRRLDKHSAEVELELNLAVKSSVPQEGLHRGWVTLSGFRGPITIPWVCLTKHS